MVYFQGDNGESAFVDVGNNITHPLTNLTAGVTYTLYVTAYNTDQIESDPSDTVTYHVPDLPPVIAAQPSSITVTPGSPISLTVQASGTGGLHYQWFKNNSALVNTTNATLVIAKAAAGDSGSYTVQVTNPGGTATSAPAIVSVQSGVVTVAPVIQSQPANISALEGGPAQISVATATGGGVSYQWWKNGQVIPGANSSVLNFSSVQLTDAGNYFVVLSNSAGSVPSESAVLTVISMPHFITPPVATGVADGESASLFADVGGTGPFTYQWFKDGTAIQDAIDSIYTIFEASSADEGNYSIQVWNMDGRSITSAAVPLKVMTPPSITNQPASVTVSLNDSFVVQVAATGTGPFSYQWYKDFSPLLDATNSGLALGAAQYADAGSYTVTVSNLAGSVDSTPADVSVVGTPKIIQDPLPVTANQGANVTLAVDVRGEAPFQYQWFKDSASLPDQTNSTLTLPSAQPSDAGVYFVVVTNSFGSVTSATAEVGVFSAPKITADLPLVTSVNLGQPATLSVGVVGSEPLVFQWYLNGNPVPDATNSAITFAAAQNSDRGAYSVRISNEFGAVRSQQSTLSVVPVPQIVSQPVGGTIAEGSSFTFQVAASSDLAVTYQWFKNGSLIAGATVTSFQIVQASASDDADYTVTISNGYGSVSSVPAHLAVLQLPKIVAGPASQTVAEGSPLNLTVETAGTGTFEYQWFKNGSAVAGATGPVLVIAEAAPGDAGDYTVKVSNGVGSVTSAAATITVLQKPVISMNPVSQTVTVGSAAIFSVQASGAGTLTFQWLKDGVVIPNATSLFLRIMSVKEADFATYTVRVSNAAGTTESAPAVLSKPARPVITQQPLSTNVTAGAAVTLSVTANGSGTLSYQWLKNGTPVPAATNPTLNLAAAQTADSGTYTASVSNQYGTVISDGATVAVQHADPDEVAGKLQPATAAAGSIQAKGIPGVAYDIQVCTNLTDGVWTTVSTVTVDSTGVFSIDTSSAANNQVWIVRTVRHEN
jgi:hypothetical protein